MSNDNIISELSASPPARVAPVSVTESASTPESPIQERPGRRTSAAAEAIISPLSSTFRSSSIAATSTSRGVSPMTIDSRRRRGSFNRLRKSSPSPRNKTSFNAQQIAAHSLQQAKEKLQRSGREGLSLQTKSHSESSSQIAQETQQTNAEDENDLDPDEDSTVEEVVEVISMSPAVATPVRSYRRSRSSITMQSSPPRVSSISSAMHRQSRSIPGSAPATYKPTGGEAHFYEMEKCKVEDKPYFGQHINSFDLVSNGIERAIEAMR